jgi:hypothetical protein
MGLFDRNTTEPDVPEDKYVAFPDDDADSYTVEYKYQRTNSGIYPHQYAFSVYNSVGKRVCEGSVLDDSKSEALKSAKTAAQRELDDYIRTMQVPDEFVEKITPSKSKR